MVTRAEDGSVYYYKKAGVNMQQIGNVHEFGPFLTRERVRSSVPWPDLEPNSWQHVFPQYFPHMTCMSFSIEHAAVAASYTATWSPEVAKSPGKDSRISDLLWHLGTFSPARRPWKLHGTSQRSAVKRDQFEVFSTLLLTSYVFFQCSCKRHGSTRH